MSEQRQSELDLRRGFKSGSVGGGFNEPV